MEFIQLWRNPGKEHKRRGSWHRVWGTGFIRRPPAQRQSSLAIDPVGTGPRLPKTVPAGKHGYLRRPPWPHSAVNSESGMRVRGHSRAGTRCEVLRHVWLRVGPEAAWYLDYDSDPGLLRRTASDVAESDDRRGCRFRRGCARAIPRIDFTDLRRDMDILPRSGKKQRQAGGPVAADGGACPRLRQGGSGSGSGLR